MGGCVGRVDDVVRRNQRPKSQDASGCAVYGSEVHDAGACARHCGCLDTRSSSGSTTAAAKSASTAPASCGSTPCLRQSPSSRTPLEVLAEFFRLATPPYIPLYSTSLPSDIYLHISIPQYRYSQPHATSLSFALHLCLPTVPTHDQYQYCVYTLLSLPCTAFLISITAVVPRSYLSYPYSRLFAMPSSYCTSKRAPLSGGILAPGRLFRRLIRAAPF
ncbi:hypothetical protein C8F01DRAFT_639214 [Mycena amicta]|nr:hypothetical protein C8F01DRAFT_639214 [Mycena amicta]